MAYVRSITFTYNANGGSGAPSSSTSQYTFDDFPNTESKQISSTKPTRQYYTFMGWSSNSGATSASWASGQTLSYTWTSSAQGNYSLTLYAVWKRSTITVTYNANGGQNAPNAQTANMYEWFALRSGVPTRQYYDFLGWATSASATTAQYQPSGNARFTANVTLYAVWKKAADVVSTSNGTMGSAMTLTITKADASYKDTITYKFGSATGTIVTGTTLSSISWTPPTTLAAQIPNASSGSLVITCQTYNGSTLVGTTTTTVTLSVPQSLAPTASVAISDTNATCAGWGVYVQSRSTLSFTITASGQQSATISSYRTTVNGAQYTSATFTTDVLLYNGSNSYTIIVTDSRGLQTTLTGTYNVETYANPTVSLVSCDRNDSNVEQVDVTFDFDIASVANNNTAEYALDYKKKSSNTWTQGTAVSCGGYSGTISDSLSNIDQGDEYDIRVRVIDAFQEASVESEVGVSGNILLNQRHIGGAGLLMKSQADNQLDIGKHAVFHASVDVIPRRAYATLNATGWKRIINYNANSSYNAQGASGQAVDICVLRTGAENHSVTMRMNSSGSISFVEESSKSSSLVIDKIRYTYDGDNIGHVDVHINSGSLYYYGADFIVHAVSKAQSKLWVSADFESVLDAPVGETVLTTYTFFPNTYHATLTLTRDSSQSYVDQTNFNRVNAYVNGNMLYIRFNLQINSLPVVQDFVKIGKIDFPTGKSLVEDILQVIPIQSSTNVVTVQILGDGTIKLYNGLATITNGWARAQLVGIFN